MNKSAVTWLGGRHLSALAAGLCLAVGAQAQLDRPDNATAPGAPVAPAPAAPAASRGQVEAGLGFADLSDGNKNWNDLYTRGHFNLRPGSTLHWSLGRQRHFGESGAIGGLTLVQDLSPDWYALLGASGGGANFQNRYRVDAGIYRKWGADRRWVTGLSLMHAASGDHIHRDNALRASAIYYAPQGYVAEGGISFNRSNPGSVWSTRVYGAATFGQAKKHWLSLRLEHGQEGYLPVALGSAFPTNVRFRSTEATIEWRQWVGRDWGYVVGGQLYRNPYYRRAGVTAGVFFDF